MTNLTADLISRYLSDPDSLATRQLSFLFFEWLSQTETAIEIEQFGRSLPKHVADINHQIEHERARREKESRETSSYCNRDEQSVSSSGDDSESSKRKDKKFYNDSSTPITAAAKLISKDILQLASSSPPLSLCRPNNFSFSDEPFLPPASIPISEPQTNLPLTSATAPALIKTASSSVLHAQSISAAPSVESIGSPSICLNEKTDVNEMDSDVIPQFYFPAIPNRIEFGPILENGESAAWTSEVSQIHIEIFSRGGFSSEIMTDGSEFDESYVQNCTVTFNELESLIVGPLLYLSRYMTGCILTMALGLSLDDDMRSLVDQHSKNPNTAAIDFVEWKAFWMRKGLCLRHSHQNFFNIVKEDHNEIIMSLDFMPFLSEILARHPSVEFLKATPDFQKRYSETVIAKILFDTGGTYDGCVDYYSLSRSSLVDCWKLIDQIPDLNSLREFFSYEHFYVVYCKFWELDSDHDFKLDRKDLVKYDNHALSISTIDRILSEFGMVSQDCESPNPLLGLDEFYYLLMLDEDKTTDKSIEFWFRVVDLDGDGVIRVHELNTFYTDQSARMESRSLDVASFHSLICQFNDMLSPMVASEFRLVDLKKHRRHAAFFFNSLLSLSKSIAWEQRDPFSYRSESTEFPIFSEWDKFCHYEYDKLAADDGGDETNEFRNLNNSPDSQLGDVDGPSFGSSMEDDVGNNNLTKISDSMISDGLIAMGSPVCDPMIR